MTIFTVGTGGMFDQRIVGAENLPRPAQWHRIAVHNEHLGAYAVQQLVKKYVMCSILSADTIKYMFFSVKIIPPGEGYFFFFSLTILVIITYIICCM